MPLASAPKSWNGLAASQLSPQSIFHEAEMNADLIETRQQALDLLDADMITFGAYVALCRHKGWQA